MIRPNSARRTRLGLVATLLSLSLLDGGKAGTRPSTSLITDTSEQDFDLASMLACCSGKGLYGVERAFINLVKEAPCNPSRSKHPTIRPQHEYRSRGGVRVI